MIKEIIFGTTNPAKVAQIQLALEPLGITVKSIGKAIDVEETGNSAQENSRTKAITYAHALGKRVMATDDALHFDGISQDEQPGVNVRRIPGHTGRPSDEEMREYYIALFTRYGGQVIGRWEFSVCVAHPDGRVKESTIFTPDRLFSATASKFLVPGFPLSSLQIDQYTGQYLSEKNSEETALFWQEAIGGPLRDFFLSLE